MTLQSEDMGKLVAGKSVLVSTSDVSLYLYAGKYEAYDLHDRCGAELRRIPAGSDLVLKDGYGPKSVWHQNLTLIGTLTPDGWIEGEWAENPVPGMAMDVRFSSGDVVSWAEAQGDGYIVSDWNADAWAGTGLFAETNPSRIIAFRPAPREAQPETDGGGEVLWGCADGNGIDERLVYRDKSRADGAALSLGLTVVPLYARPTPEGQTEGATVAVPVDVVERAIRWLRRPKNDLNSYAAADDLIAALASKGV